MADTEKIKKPIYKKWWFWIIIVLLVIVIGSNGSSDNNTSTNNYQKGTTVEITVADFSTMSKDEVQAWFDTNKINGKITEEYSSSIAKGNFISQSITTNTVIHQGDKIIVTYSLGKEPSTEEKNALKKAELYSKTMHMSKQGIYNQLTSSVEGFTKEAAQYAINNIDVDWNANALAKAKSYQQTMSMSKQGVYNLLTSTVEGFTKEQAQYAIDHLDD